MIFAKDRDEQVAAARALDRVLLANDYVIPQFYRGELFIAYWNTIVRPTELPYYVSASPRLGGRPVRQNELGLAL